MRPVRGVRLRALAHAPSRALARLLASALRPSHLTPDLVAALPIAYAGEPGAFAEDAVIAAFGDVERQPVGGFREVFEAVTPGEAGSGVVPIENLVNGSVREVYDLLLEHDLEITGEVVVPVDLCLAAPQARPSTTSSACTRTSRRWARRSGSCARDAGIC